MSDYISISGRAHANNWLKNGNFARLPKNLVAKSYPDPNAYSPPQDVARITLADAITPENLSILVGTVHQNEFIAGWSVYGSKDRLGAMTVDPVDQRTGRRLQSFDSGHLLRVSFNDFGTITIEQSVDVINHFRGMPATLAFSAYKYLGEVRVEADIDFGTETKNCVPYFSSYIGAYRRIRYAVETCPLGLTQIVIRVKITGRPGEAACISGMMFSLGDFPLDLPYTDSFADNAIPSGAIILWEGDSCPPGYRPVKDADDAFLFQTYGDPNVLSGGKEEWKSVGTGDSDRNSKEASVPETRTTLGDNEHFAHQSPSLFGRMADKMLSNPPDIVKLLATADFNDEGEPPGPGPTWANRTASVAATYADGVGWPFDPSDFGVIAKFKLTTVQNEVLPAEATNWTNGHKHSLSSSGAETLPPYKTYRFCEKI